MADLSRKNQTVDLNALKSAACRKYGLARAPKLVEMIAALPDSDASHCYRNSEPNRYARRQELQLLLSCRSLTGARISRRRGIFACIVLVDRTQTSSTVRSRILVMNLPACVRFELGRISAAEL
ncbi:hypothetical protein OIU77_007567 [Salix suchowensis]|uniref:ELP3-like N-terminal domain-containing protein n=1 Tax=Salix suchowensis TaxID=1278906 RepID=A0ABQ9AHS2_9ROSI|nr:hypothetical protein OIU77_007567 [Salix suchowensis]